MIKVLYISNMYPSNEKGYAGIFIKKQVDFFHNNYVEDVKLDVYAMQRSFTSGFKTQLKYIHFFLKFIPFLFKQYDIIHVHYLVPTVVLGWSYKLFHRKAKLIVTLHGRDITVQYAENKKILKPFTKSIDLIISVGQTLHEIAQKEFPGIKKEILPVGVDDTVFKRMPVEKNYDLIFVGSFIQRKGLDLLVRALQEWKMNKLRCLFIGSGELHMKISELNEYHHITILNDLAQSEISRLLNESKFLVLPSRNEGFPTVTIESFYCGVPVLGSNIPQIVEQITDEKNGFIFEVNNVQSLKEKISHVLTLNQYEYQKLQENALASFKEIALSRVCDKLLKIYNA